MALELALTDLYTDVNLKAYYRFSTGALTTDSSGEGHTLTTIGTPAEGTGIFDGGVDLATHTGVQVDAYNAGYDKNYQIYAGATTYVGQSFTGDGSKLTSCKFYLYKLGSPTGNATAYLFTHSGTYGTSSVGSGTNLAASATFDVSTLTGSIAPITFTFNGTYTLVDGTHYVIAVFYNGGDASNRILAGCDGTIVGAGHDGNLCYFNGSWNADSTDDALFYVYGTINDTYSVANHADFRPTGDFSVGFWIKTTSATYQHPFTSWSVISSKYYGIFVRVRTNGLLQGFSCLGTGTVENTHFDTVESTTSVADGDWHFGVFTWDGSYLRMYCDGVMEGETAWANAPVYNATNYVRIGSRSDAGLEAYPVIGSLDDVFLINGTALTAAQISHIYNAVRGTKTFPNDALLYKRLTKTFVGDAKLWSQKTKTFTNDAKLWGQKTKTFVIDALLYKTQIDTFDIDALLYKVNNETFTIDAKLWKQNTDTFISDALLYKTNTKGITVDAKLAKFVLKTFNIDALLFAIRTVTLSADALLYRIVTDTFSIDAKLWKQDTKTFEVDARLWSQKVNTFAVDALLYTQSTKDVLLDANLAKANQILPFTLDARLYAVGTKPLSLDADLWKTLILDFTLDALLVTNKTKTFNSDALLYRTNTNNFLSDAILYEQLISQFSLDAKLYKIQTKTFNIDALLYGQKTKTVVIDAILYKTSITTMVVDAYLATNKIKIWNGTTWIEGSVKLWDGNAWVDKPFRYYDGSEWRFN